MLIAIGVGIGTPAPDDDTTGDFERAVRSHVIASDGSVNLSPLMGITPKGEPMGIAFLASQVSAASRIADDGGINQINYL